MRTSLLCYFFVSSHVQNLHSPVFSESTILSLACSPRFWAWKSSPSATVSLAQRIIISLKRIRTYGPTQRCWLRTSKMDSLCARRKKCALGKESTEGIMFRCKNFLINAAPIQNFFASLLLVYYVSCTAISSLLYYLYLVIDCNWAHYIIPFSTYTLFQVRRWLYKEQGLGYDWLNILGSMVVASLFTASLPLRSVSASSFLYLIGTSFMTQINIPLRSWIPIVLSCQFCSTCR